MRRVSGALWLAVAGAALAFVSLGTNFYLTTSDGETRARDAWFGIAHASEFILATALIAIVFTILIAVNRSLLSGRRAGLTIGIMGTIASLHLAYRMVAPPFDFTLDSNMTVADLFGSCLGYCPPSQAGEAELLPGIFMALAGVIAVAVGGFLYAMSRNAAATEPNFWRADQQAGLTPWMMLAGAGAVGQFLFGYTFFTFWLVTGDSGTTRWAGWFASPHTAVLVLWVSILVVGLAVQASRKHAPMSPFTMGAVVAVLGFLSGSRIFYRMIEPPFGGGTRPADIGTGAILALASAIVIVVAGIAQAMTNREEVEIGEDAADAKAVAEGV